MWGPQGRLKRQSLLGFRQYHDHCL